MGSWGIGPFDNDDAGEALIKLDGCKTENEFAAKVSSFIQYHQSDEFDEDDEYKAIASSAIVCLISEGQEFETTKLEIIESNPFRFQVPNDFQSIRNRFSNVDLTGIVPEALKALSKISNTDSYVYELREGDVSWLSVLNELDLRLKAYVSSE